MLTSKLQNLLFYSGILLIALAAVAMILNLSGMLTFPETILGSENTLHSLARVAVAGCALAAIGSWERTPSN